MGIVSTRSSRSPDTADGGAIGYRKKRHVEICIDPDRYRVEGTVSAGFDGVRLLHHALPELAEEEVDSGVSFLGCSLSLPLFISCMTGGSLEGFAANRNLAVAAQQARVPVGLGSIRVIFEHEEVFDHFHIKPLAPDVPVMANLGAVQVRDMPHLQIVEMLKRLEVQALVIHLNPGQELFQPDGDRDFRGLMPAISRLCDSCPLPIIAKETGFGISPSLARELLGLGVSAIDVAGAGGTNWVAVESYRLPQDATQAARELDDWGLPTAVVLDVLRDDPGTILASGGLRTGLDVAKAVALGAELGGLALPFIRAVSSGGVDSVLALIQNLSKTIRSVMLLSGCADVSALRAAPLMRAPWFRDAVQQLRQAEPGGG